MLSLAHTATGAYIATKIPHPAISIPLILASHYLEDYILHWDVGTGLSTGSKHPLQAFKHEILDLVFSFFLIYFLFQYGQPHLNYTAWIGAFISLIPDFLEAPRNFLKVEPKWLTPLNMFHSKFHHSTKNLALGLLPQVLILLLIALTL